ncbi:MAG: hypothetical protein GX640_00420 [Fibrobacter sp.]|nr:hypothetical protein [Fibrobacter sp.]
MSDTYVECMIARKSNPFYVAVKVLLYVLTALCVFLVILGGAAIMLIPAAILGNLIYFWVPGFDLEFEYLYLDKEISIDKILGRRRRKKVRVIDLNKVDMIAPEFSHELDAYKDRGIKKLDYSSKDPAVTKHIFVYNGEHGTELICMEPNADMLKCIKNVFPRKLREY